MIRSWIRTSDACRTAFDIAYGNHGRSDVLRAASQFGPAMQPTSSGSLLGSPVNIKSQQPDVQSSPSTGGPPVASSLMSTERTKINPSVEKTNPPEEDLAGAILTGTSTLGHGQDTSSPGHSLSTEATSSNINMRSSAVPSSRFARLFQYGGLAVGVGLGTAQAALSRNTNGNRPAYLSERNVRRIVETLSRMRGAALKLGQFLSIQDSKTLPPELREILARVQNAADYMPWWQTEATLVEGLGDQWRDRFAYFQQTPIAAASIGQVHRAALHDGTQVAVKIQFPGIAKSITSDIGYIKTLLTVSALLPKGLFLDKSLGILSRELREECDYIREASACRRFHTLLNDENTPYTVPRVFDSLCTDRILTLEYMNGKPLSQLRQASQALRDHIGELIVTLCLREIFEFRYMQTDPNWSNFLWNEETSKLEIVDFGASRAYPESFSQQYKEMLLAAKNGERATCESISRDLGFLTSQDGPEMINAHVDSVLALAEPFMSEVYDFGHEDITSRIRSHIPTILQHRSTAPPSESYSLNRKLSGCFLLCANLGSRVRCRRILADIC